MAKQHSIALRPLLRYFGLLVPVVVGLPSVFGVLFFLTHPRELMNNWPGALMASCFAAIGGFFSWRWLRLGAEIRESEIVMRGLLRTIRIPRTGFKQFSKEWYQDHSHEHGSMNSYSYLFMDSDGKKIATMPSSLEICLDFSVFEGQLVKIAADNRKNSGHSLTRDLQHLPVDQWTLDDIEKYEQDAS